MPMEIERKFLLPEFPHTQRSKGELVLLAVQRIEQTYLALDDEQEIRVRKLTTYEGEKSSSEDAHVYAAATDAARVHYTHTFKQGNGVQREEIEYGITAAIYEQLMQASGAVPLTKDRYTFQWGARKLEVDVYDQLQLTVAEVEFATLQEAQAFQSPEWLGPDISSQRQYSNKTVWRQLQQGS